MNNNESKPEIKTETETETEIVTEISSSRQRLINIYNNMDIFKVNKKDKRTEKNIVGISLVVEKKDN